MKIIKWLKNKKAFFFTQQIDMEITLHPIELYVEPWSMKIEGTFGNFCNSQNNLETLNWSCSDINAARMTVKGKEM